ncbi:hypothetical protein AEA09_07290 [Lysinibacillus contaminans]|uniref:DUF4376 domain-containing protein n=1 Tax=Lysinibacillus contaminans TaxID=1293441 RepID=A0ABR5K0R3_9BACI|nr:hypothetical protein [Lysinibacillus contaminans]KOS68378.1 hypothetical protein AEA09_07290 [Lysinibacillus contaminans]
MQKQVYEIDVYGWRITIDLADVDENGNILDGNKKDWISVDPHGIFKPKWNSTEWIEGATQEEIDEITGNTLDVVKIRKINELDELCKQTILGRFKVTINEIEYEFSYDAEAQSRFNGIGLLFFANKISEIEWTAYENEQRVRIVLNQSNFDIVSLAALQHQKTNVTKYNQLLQQVNDATTKEQVEAIVW